MLLDLREDFAIHEAFGRVASHLFFVREQVIQVEKIEVS
jgi:hypothetical protein